MLRFPVALLTATALIEAITRVVYRHLSLMKMRSRYATGMSANTEALFLEEKRADEESRIVLHAMSGLFDDIRTVLGLSAVRHSNLAMSYLSVDVCQDKIGECEEWLATVRWVSAHTLRSKYFPAVPK
jgi:hypothetical protein